MFGSFRGWKRLRKSTHGDGRVRKIVNLHDARRIGILYTLDEVEDYDIVAEFVTSLQHDHKEVKALGYVKNKNLVTRFLPKLSYDFFSKKDINWLNTPVQTKVRDFIHQEFDILIDLSPKEIFPLKYISCHSMAHCRVGRNAGDKADCYDLMIDAGSAMPVREMIRQVTHYLSVINSNVKTAL